MVKQYDGENVKSPQEETQFYLFINKFCKDMFPV